MYILYVVKIIDTTTHIEEENEFEITGFDNPLNNSNNTGLSAKQKFKNQYVQNMNETSQIHQNMMPNSMAAPNQMMPADLNNMMQQPGFIQQPQPGYMPGYNMGYQGYVPPQMNPHFVRPQNMPNTNA